MSTQNQSGESQVKKNQVGKKWTRTKNGWLGGVCGGLAKTLDLNATVFRIFTFIGIVFFGLTVPMYLVLWFFMPREDQQYEPDTKMLFGVCLKLADRFNIEVSWVRILTILLPIPSMGLTVLIYFCLALVLPENKQTTV